MNRKDVQSETIEGRVATLFLCQAKRAADPGDGATRMRTRCCGTRTWIPPGGIILRKGEAGAESEHHLSFPEMKDAVAFIEKGLQVLYAGAVAQSLDASGKCQPEKCHGFLLTNATDHMSKIRELSRVLAGMTDPGLDEKAYADKLAANDERFSNQALKIVEANAALIRELVDNFMLALKETVKGHQTIARGAPPLNTYLFASAKIDAIIAKRPIICR